MDSSGLKRFSIPHVLHQSSSSMHALLPDGHHRQPATTLSITEFCTSLELLQARGVTVLADVTFSAMWTAQCSKIQRLISQQLKLQGQQRVFLLLMLLRSTIRFHLMTSPSANRVSSTASVLKAVTAPS
jgi:hypothetical protein